MIGLCFEFTEYIVGTADGIYKCRTLSRNTEEMSYNPEWIEFLKILKAPRRPPSR